MKKLRFIPVLILLLTIFTIHAAAATYDSNGFSSDGLYQPADKNGSYYEISNAGQLYWFAQQVNNGSTNLNGKLTADITINTQNVMNSSMGMDYSNQYRPWIAMGTTENPFSGIFDGNGHTISGLYCYLSSNNVSQYGTSTGLFHSSSGTIQNLTIRNAFFYAYNYGAALCDVNTGTISNCDVEAVITSYDFDIGGLCRQNKGTIQDSAFRGESYYYANGSAYGPIGGLVNQNEDTGTIRNCVNYAEVTNGGGICGGNGGIISNCRNEGTIVSTKTACGGIAARNSGTISDCINLSAIEAGTNGYSATNVGGICGSNDGLVERCINHGDINGSGAYMGGLCGVNQGKKEGGGIIRNSYSTGDVTQTNSTTESASGLLVGTNTADIRYCYATGDITRYSYTHRGFLVGYNKYETMHDSNGKPLYSYGGTVTQCVYLNGAPGNLIGVQDNGASSSYLYDFDDLDPGEAAWILNGKASTGAWYQNLDNGQTKDTYPVLDNTHGKVYYYSFSRTYSNHSPCTHGSTAPVPGYDATCTTPGRSDGTSCLICGQSVTAGQELPATGHTLTVTEWSWNTDLTEATAVLGCQNCSHSEDRTAAVTIEETTAPTLTTVGQNTHTAVLTVGETRYTDVRYSEIPVLVPHIHTVCADSSCADGHEEITWQPWESTTTLPNSSGNYYLVNDIMLSDTHVFSSYGTTLEIRLCLNGKSVMMEQTSPIPNVIEAGNKTDLTITDCSATVRFGNLDANTKRWTPSTVSGNCNLTGGVIAGGSCGISCRSNSVTHIYGGNLAGNSCGLYVYGGTANLHGGSISYNASAYDCSGVRLNAGTFNMTGGSISHNRYYATSGLRIGAGGVFVSSSIFNMSGGVIEDNHAAGCGGGVRVNSGGYFYMTGGSITNNTATQNGGGVYIHDYSSRVFFAKSPVIQGNTADSKSSNLYFYQAAYKATITAPLTAEAAIGVSMGNPGVFTIGWNAKMGDSEIVGFFSDAGESLPVAMDPSGELRLGVHTHSWGQWTVDTAPTTETAGSLIRHCSADLAHDETLVLPALNDTDYTVTVSTAPTLIAPGENIYTYTEPETQQDFSFSVVVPAIGQEMIDRVTVTTNPDTGAITMENIPDGVIVVLAGYNGGKMVQVQFRTGDTVTFSPIDAETTIAFFLTGNYIPVAQPKTIS